MKVGIPRALLYFKNEKFWTTLFKEMGIEYILSPETNKEIINDGANLAIDETCLPTKILLGSINWLIDKCDYIFIPRIAYAHGQQMCTKFLAQTDLVYNTFRDRNPKLLFYDIDNKKVTAERKAILKMGKFLHIPKNHVKLAYILAKQTQLYYEMFRCESQENVVKNSNKNKILIVAHAYNIKDKYVGEPIIEAVKNLNCEPIIAEYFNAEQCIQASRNVSKTLPWGYNRHLVGAIEMYKDNIDGIILLTTFPCGPDSMVNDMIIRKYKNIPIITLTVDTQDGTAGMQTRLESFVDIINFKKGNL